MAVLCVNISEPDNRGLLNWLFVMEINNFFPFLLRTSNQINTYIVSYTFYTLFAMIFLL